MTKNRIVFIISKRLTSRAQARGTKWREPRSGTGLSSIALATEGDAIPRSLQQFVRRRLHRLQKRKTTNNKTKATPESAPSTDGYCVQAGGFGDAAMIELMPQIMPTTVAMHSIITIWEKLPPRRRMIALIATTIAIPIRTLSTVLIVEWCAERHLLWATLSYLRHDA
jgi:hypothetical protein